MLGPGGGPAAGGRQPPESDPTILKSELQRMRAELVALRYTKNLRSEFGMAHGSRHASTLPAQRSIVRERPSNQRAQAVVKAGRRPPPEAARP